MGGGINDILKKELPVGGVASVLSDVHKSQSNPYPHRDAELFEKTPNGQIKKVGNTIHVPEK